GCQDRRRLPLCSRGPRVPARPSGGQLIEAPHGQFMPTAPNRTIAWGQRAGMAPEGTSPCGPRAAGNACRLWRLFSARLLVVNAEGRLLRGRGKAALDAFV